MIDFMDIKDIAIRRPFLAEMLEPFSPGLSDFEGGSIPRGMSIRLQTEERDYRLSFMD